MYVTKNQNFYEKYFKLDKQFLTNASTLLPLLLFGTNLLYSVGKEVRLAWQLSLSII